jgi:hypothetical protein
MLDQSVLEEEGPRCSYCRRAGHNILSCEAPGADAERRRRDVRKEKKAEVAGNSRALFGAAPAPPVAVVVGAAAPPSSSSMPRDYVRRMQEKSVPVSVVRSQQDDAYERALVEDREKQEEEALRAILEQSLREEEEGRLRDEEEENRNREALIESAKLEREATRAKFREKKGGSVSLRFTLPSGAVLQQSFAEDDTVSDQVAAFLLCQEELVGVRWEAVELPLRTPLISGSNQITFARETTVGALGRLSIRVFVVEEE